MTLFHARDSETTPRFDHDADSIRDACHYMRNRGVQLLPYDFKLKSILPVAIDPDPKAKKKYSSSFDFVGVEGVFDKRGKTFYSLYILKEFRGKNLFARYDKSPIVTIDDCGIVPFLKAKSIPHEVAGGFLNNPAYQYISSVYGDTKAKRSGCYFMEHIDEGLAVLRHIQATQYAKEGYCLHPIFQDDQLFSENVALTNLIGSGQHVIALAVEYRNVANAYLSPMGRRLVKDIALSPLPEVNDMLIADKVQNRKAFESCRERYTNAAELDYYFRAWLERLEVSEERYQELKELITIDDFGLRT